MRSDRVESEGMVVKSKPDVLQRPIVMTLRQMGRVAEPPAIVDQRLPQKRPLADVAIEDNHFVVVKNVAVAKASQVNDRGSQDYARQKKLLPAAEAGPRGGSRGRWGVGSITAFGFGLRAFDAAARRPVAHYRSAAVPESAICGGRLAALNSSWRLLRNACTPSATPSEGSGIIHESAMSSSLKSIVQDSAPLQGSVAQAVGFQSSRWRLMKLNIRRWPSTHPESIHICMNACGISSSTCSS